MWERLFEIVVINERIDLLEQLAVRILSALKRYVIPKGVVYPGSVCLKEGMLRTLRSALCRVSALVWNEKIGGALRKIDETIKELFGSTGEFPVSLMTDFALENMSQTRAAYCQTRMVNKYVIPLPIDCVLSRLCFSDKAEDAMELYDLTAMREHLAIKWDEPAQDYIYYPYMLKPEELSFALLCTELAEREDNKLSFDMYAQTERMKAIFLRRNYPNLPESEKNVFELSEVRTKPISKGPAEEHFVTQINDTTARHENGKLCVAIGNVELLESNFVAALDRRPNRGYERYKQLSKILDEAIDQKVDLLVLPENYLPFEWLPIVIRTCSNNQMALVTGIEHLIVSSGDKEKIDKVVNLTATILPYMHQQQKFAYVAYHNKTAYSPDEKLYIKNYGYTYQEGKTYHLFRWRDVWFPVYCCFELASIRDRALFHSCADLVVAVEWNKDIAYFSSIIESMCRDLHCYCIQANSSGPGDSRVLQPTRSEKRDIVKTKGGKNPCILAADIDIEELRNFQRLGPDLQRKKDFKATPPDYSEKFLQHRREGTLFQFLTEEGQVSR